MELGGFVRAGFAWSDCVRNFFISAHDLREAGLKNEVHDTKHPELPFKIEGILKEAGVVPKDAHMIGWWHPYNMNGFIVRFAHKDFPEVPPGNMPLDETVDLRKLIRGS